MTMSALVGSGRDRGRHKPTKFVWTISVRDRPMRRPAALCALLLMAESAGKALPRSLSFAGCCIGWVSDVVISRFPATFPVTQFEHGRRVAHLEWMSQTMRP